MKRLRILVIMDENLVPPDSSEGYEEREIDRWRTEYDVVSTLRDLGHQVQPLGVHDDLGVIRRGIEEFNPEIAFNLVEAFHGVATYEYYVVSYLELMRRPYTGCNPRGLMLAHDKALCKEVLSYHRVPVPRFGVFRMGRKVRRPSHLDYPMLVKSLTEDGSVGISQASVVSTDEKLAERVDFIHQNVGTDAIVEEFVDGRELYLGVIGNRRLQCFPILEMIFHDLPDRAARIATYKVKWDEAYRKKIGIELRPPDDLGADLVRRIEHLCKRTYRRLGMSGYARMDLRLTADGRVFLIEANPNPELSYGAELAEAAELAGVPYDKLLQRLVNLGLRYRPKWKA